MTQRITQGTRKNNNTYSGTIEYIDFDTYHSAGDLASRIASDLRFDEQCRRNVLNKFKGEKKNA